MGSWKDKLREAKELFLEDLITAEEFADMKAEILELRAKEQAAQQEDEDIFSGGETRFVSSNSGHQDTFGVGITQAPSPFISNSDSSPKHQQLSQGTIFDSRYVIVLPLGKGGMGAVYQAVDMVTGQPIAVKTLHPQFAKNKAVIDSLVQEVALGQRLNHPNLLQIRHLETKSDIPYLIMELMDGGDAQELAQSNGGILTGEQLLPIIEATCSGLSALHKEAIVHLDIKPQNILVTKSGRICLADFGISSKMKDQRKGHSGSGTILYAAPEQLQGRECGVGSDIYAVGMMCYQLLTGTFPFDSNSSADAILMWHSKGDRDFRGVSLAIQSILQKACHVDINQRYRNALSFYHDVQHAVEGHIQPSQQNQSTVKENPNLEKYKAIYEKILEDGYTEEWEKEQLKGAQKQWDISEFEAEQVHKAFQDELYRDLEVVLDGRAFFNAQIGSVVSLPIRLHNKELVLLEKIQIRYRTVDWECKELEVSSLKGSKSRELSFDVNLDAFWTYSLEMVVHIRDFLGNDRYFKTPQAPFLVSKEGIQACDWKNRLMEQRENQHWSLLLMPSSQEEWNQFITKKTRPSKKYTKARKVLLREKEALEQRIFLKEVDQWHQMMKESLELKQEAGRLENVIQSKDFLAEQLDKKTTESFEEEMEARLAQLKELVQDLEDNRSIQKKVSSWDQILTKPELLMQNEWLLPDKKMQILIREWKRLEKEEPNFSRAEEIQRLWEKRHYKRIEKQKEREKQIEATEQRLERVEKELKELEGKFFSILSSKKIEELKNRIKRIEESLEDLRTRRSNIINNREEDSKESKQRKEEAIAEAKKDYQAQINPIRKKLIEVVQQKRAEFLSVEEEISDVAGLQKKEAELEKTIAQKKAEQIKEIDEAKRQTIETVEKDLEPILEEKTKTEKELSKCKEQLKEILSDQPSNSFHQNLRKHHSIVPIEAFQTYFTLFPQKREAFQNLFGKTPSPFTLFLAIFFLSEKKKQARVQALKEIQKMIQQNPDWENPLLLKIGKKHPYQTIREAVEKAPRGAVLYIDTGTYSEKIELTKDLHLIGTSKTVITKSIHCSSANFAEVSIFDCTLQAKKEVSEALYFYGLSSATVAQCRISSKGKGINITGGVEHYIFNNQIQGCATEGINLSLKSFDPDVLIERNIIRRVDVGIFCFNSQKFCIRENRIFESDSGILLSGHKTTGLIEKNDIYENDGVAIGCAKGSSPVIRNNRVYGGQSAGIVISSQSNPLVQSNKIYQNAKAGITIGKQGKGIIEENDIYENTAANIWLGSEANPIIQNNKIHDGKVSGIHCSGQMDCLIEKNDIYNNKENGVWIQEEANPALRNNKIHHNQNSGCRFTKSGKGLIEDNDIFENMNIQVVIKEESYPLLKNNRIYNGKTAGILVSEKGDGIIEGNDIFGHIHCGIKIDSGARPLIQSNKIHDNKQSGIWVAREARGLVEKNHLYNTAAKFKAIRFDEEARATVQDNIIK